MFAAAIFDWNETGNRRMDHLTIPNEVALEPVIL